MKQGFLALLLVLCTFSCSTMHFRVSANPDSEVHFTGNPADTREVSFQINREFLLWGLVPAHQTVYIDKELENIGLRSISKLIIYEKRTTGDVLASIVTLGFYNPRTFIITGFTEP